MKKTKINYFSLAREVISGGVNSPVRAWRAVGGDPVFIRHAKGSKIYDIAGREYVDFVLSWGPMILGHAHTEVVAAICSAAQRGTSFGAPTETETQMASLICRAIPSIERVRMTSSGTEATMTAIRLARGYTGRNKIIKFDGCYHGHADSLLTKAGSGVATLGIPDSPGVPQKLASLTISLPYNDREALLAAMKSHGAHTAAVIIEPVAGNMGVVIPEKNYLELLRELTRAYGILLIFDEVITGFRFTFGGYQNLAGIKPDLTCLGKIIGGGLPVGALGGKKKIMEMLAPAGEVYQAGTLSGNPLAMNAGLTTLNILESKAIDYGRLEKDTNQLCLELKKIFSAKGIATCINQFHSMFTIFFQQGPVENFAAAKKSDTSFFARFFHGMIKNGVWLTPSQFEANFLSFAHTKADTDFFLQACENTVKYL